MHRAGPPSGSLRIARRIPRPPACHAPCLSPTGARRAPCLPGYAPGLSRPVHALRAARPARKPYAEAERRRAGGERVGKRLRPPASRLLVRAPLSVKATAIREPSAAPTRKPSGEPCGPAPEWPRTTRAATVAASHNGPIMRRCDFPGHVRMPSAPARAPHAFGTLAGTPGTLRAETEAVFCSLPGRLPGAGLSPKASALSVANDAPPLPRPAKPAPMRKAGLPVRPVRLQVFTARTAPQPGLLVSMKGNPPLAPVFPSATLQASGGGRPQLQARQHPSPRSRHRPGLRFARHGQRRPRNARLRALPGKHRKQEVTAGFPQGNRRRARVAVSDLRASRYGPPHPPPARPSRLCAAVSATRPRRHARRAQAPAGEGQADPPTLRARRQRYPPPGPPLPEKTTSGFLLPASGTLLFPAAGGTRPEPD